MLEQLNQYAPLISAVAAFVSMGAAVAVAIFSVGTWKLYKLEKVRAESEKEELDGIILGAAAHCIGGLWGLEGFLLAPEEERSPERYEETMYEVYRAYRTLSREVPYLLERARTVSPETARRLMYVRTVLQRLGESLPDPEWDYAPDLDRRLLDCLDELHRIARNLEEVAPFPLEVVRETGEAMTEACGHELANEILDLSTDVFDRRSREQGELPEVRSVELGLREGSWSAPSAERKTSEQPEGEGSE